VARERDESNALVEELMIAANGRRRAAALVTPARDARYASTTARPAIDQSWCDKLTV